MKFSDSRPLTPALRRVLEASLTLCTTDAQDAGGVFEPFAGDDPNRVPAHPAGDERA